MWKQQWENYCIITGLLDQPEDYKCAMLLHSIGNETMRIFNALKFGDGEDRIKMADVMKNFDQHFLGQTQEFFERFQLKHLSQESGETIDEYVLVLRRMAKTCGFLWLYAWAVDNGSFFSWHLGWQNAGRTTLHARFNPCESYWDRPGKRGRDHSHGSAEVWRNEQSQGHVKAKEAHQAHG